jgi:hypothetical protein
LVLEYPNLDSVISRRVTALCQVDFCFVGLYIL